MDLVWSAGKIDLSHFKGANMRIIKLLLLCYCFSGPALLAQTSESKKLERHTERVSGHYRITKIEVVDKDSVSIHFEADPKTTKYKNLVLRNDQVQLGLKEGQAFRMSAEVIPGAGDTHDITQVLLFLPSAEFGEVPVWLLSNQFGPQEIRGARWIEMHAPQADYRVF